MEHAKADDEGLTVADVSELFFVPRELAASLLEMSEQDLDNLLSDVGIPGWPQDYKQRTLANTKISRMAPHRLGKPCKHCKGVFISLPNHWGSIQVHA